MPSNERTDKIIVQKIIGYCDTIAELMSEFNNSYELYLTKAAFQLSVNMCIIQIGELTTRLSLDFKEKNSSVEWRKIKALRNIHAHDYDNLNFQIMWEVLTKAIPKLREDLQTMYLSFDKEG